MLIKCGIKTIISIPFQLKRNNNLAVYDTDDKTVVNLILLPIFLLFI